MVERIGGYPRPGLQSKLQVLEPRERPERKPLIDSRSAAESRSTDRISVTQTLAEMAERGVPADFSIHQGAPATPSKTASQTSKPEPTPVGYDAQTWAAIKASPDFKTQVMAGADGKPVELFTGISLELAERVIKAAGASQTDNASGTNEIANGVARVAERVRRTFTGSSLTKAQLDGYVQDLKGKEGLTQEERQDLLAAEMMQETWGSLSQGGDRVGISNVRKMAETDGDPSNLTFLDNHIQGNHTKDDTWSAQQWSTIEENSKFETAYAQDENGNFVKVLTGVDRGLIKDVMKDSRKYHDGIAKKKKGNDKETFEKYAQELRGKQNDPAARERLIAAEFVLDNWDAFQRAGNNKKVTYEEADELSKLDGDGGKITLDDFDIARNSKRGYGKNGTWKVVAGAVAGVAATVLTAGALGPAVGAAMTGVIAGAAGGVASSAVGLIDGRQSFCEQMKSLGTGLAMGAIGGAVASPLASAATAAQASGNLIRQVGIGAAQGAIRGAVTTTAGELVDGDGKAFDLQETLKATAAGAVGGAAGAGIGKGISNLGLTGTVGGDALQSAAQFGTQNAFQGVLNGDSATDIAKSFAIGAASGAARGAVQHVANNAIQTGMGKATTNIGAGIRGGLDDMAGSIAGNLVGGALSGKVDLTGLVTQAAEDFKTGALVAIQQHKNEKLAAEEAKHLEELAQKMQDEVKKLKALSLANPELADAIQGWMPADPSALTAEQMLNWLGMMNNLGQHVAEDPGFLSYANKFAESQRNNLKPDYATAEGAQKLYDMYQDYKASNASGDAQFIFASYVTGGKTSKYLPDGSGPKAGSPEDALVKAAEAELAKNVTIDTHGKYITENYNHGVSSGNGKLAAWCATFISTMLENAGGSPFNGFERGFPPGYIPVADDILAWGMKNDRYLPPGSTPQPGDIAVILSKGWDPGELVTDADGSYHGYHVGIVTEVGKDGKFATIEGNTKVGETVGVGVHTDREKWNTAFVRPYKPVK